MDFFWWLLWIFYFAAYLYVVILIISDLFRDDKVSGWLKALWIIALVFVPFLTALVYIIVNGKGMAERAYAARGAAPSPSRTTTGPPRPPAPPKTSRRRRSCSTPASSARASSTPSRARRSETSTSAHSRRDEKSGCLDSRHPLFCSRTGGGTRTHTPLRATEFESVASAIPPHRPGTSANDHTVGFKRD